MQLDKAQSAEQTVKSRYPRSGESFRLKPTTGHHCQYRGCHLQAQWERVIQFGYMRGTDDASVKVCTEHRRIPAGDVQDWVKNFPQEAWKS